ncbi:type II toxin-antitoxin system YafQ family toxin [Fructobacillus sp. M2-14]|uniref:Type II toxin-antitoxin system YafQ family toxin n=1 Tax=Fructobacillus broussonetiae TaxID=2713173 RepID=A0ABS5QYH9_9LACO|nr:type II toxin-antitoxin system YafQ family toxin [Fructobacillus broussonetiae]MBS9338245.1 type II toxin-antitoxin system YafQ family toxin [Fructobacillus broussonetiae]
MYKCKPTKKFQSQLKRLTRLDREIKGEVLEVIEILCEGQGLPVEFNNHRLKRKLSSYYECHIRTPMKGQRPCGVDDVLLLYRIREQPKLLIPSKIGSHDELFSGQNKGRQSKVK